MTVFLDTVGLLALWDESDQWHGAAQTGFNQMFGSDSNVVTTNFGLKLENETRHKSCLREAPKPSFKAGHFLVTCLLDRRVYPAC
jgi:hypothetical protein